MVACLPLPSTFVPPSSLEPAEDQIAVMQSRLANAFPGSTIVPGTPIIDGVYYQGDFLVSGIDYRMSKLSQCFELLTGDRDEVDAIGKVYCVVQDVESTLGQRVDPASLTFQRVLTDLTIFLGRLDIA